MDRDSLLIGSYEARPSDRDCRSIELRESESRERFAERLFHVVEHADGRSLAKQIRLGGVAAPVYAGHVPSLRDVRDDLVQLAANGQRRFSRRRDIRDQRLPAVRRIRHDRILDQLRIVEQAPSASSRTRPRPSRGPSRTTCDSAIPPGTPSAAELVPCLLSTTLSTFDTFSRSEWIG